MERERIIVGLSGASGVILGIRLLEELSQKDGIETHLIVSDAARRTIEMETEWKVEDVETLAFQVHDFRNIGSSISSGSYKTKGMVVIPCSIKTLSAIAHSFNTNLLIRAADVVLKERRRLVLVPREMPLHRGHLELMLRVQDLGGIILPPMLTFYHKPKTVEEMVDYIVGKVFDSLEIDHGLYKRWG
ncbi:MAG: UbiX family flavin prenyltransferase [Thermodesulfobacteriota bacterium]|nr:UbiX family flavin prenyltransferase [Thermodesulfobacteriota bacterium]